MTRRFESLIAIVYFLARKIRLFDNSGCKHFFTLLEDPVMAKKISSNYSGMLIGHPIAILYFLERKITTESTEDTEKTATLCALRVLCG